MKKKGTIAVQRITGFFEILTIGLIAAALYFAQWQSILHPFISTSAFIYAVFSVLMVGCIVCGDVAIWILIYGSNKDFLHINLEDWIKTSKGLSIWKKIKGALYSIFSNGWRFAVVIFFAYSGHFVLSVINTVYLFGSLFMLWLIHQAKHQLKNKEEPSEETPEKESGWL